METKIENIVAALKLIDAVTENHYYDKLNPGDGSLIDMMELRDVFAIMMDSNITFWKDDKYTINFLQDEEDIRCIAIKIEAFEKPIILNYENLNVENLIEEAVETEDYECAAFLRDLGNCIVINEIVVEESKNHL